MTETDYEAMARLIERLEETSGELRALADDEGVPAVERNAKRVEATVRVLRQNVPPELVEE